VDILEIFRKYFRDLVTAILSSDSFPMLFNGFSRVSPEIPLETLPEFKRNLYGIFQGLLREYSGIHLGISGWKMCVSHESLIEGYCPVT